MTHITNRLNTAGSGVRTASEQRWKRPAQIPNTADSLFRPNKTIDQDSRSPLNYLSEGYMKQISMHKENRSIFTQTMPKELLKPNTYMQDQMNVGVCSE